VEKITQTPSVLSSPFSVIHSRREMNARSHVFELAVESWQTEEACLAIFHPILFHR
jgi:hypothetical protein